MILNIIDKGNYMKVVKCRRTKGCSIVYGDEYKDTCIYS